MLNSSIDRSDTRFLKGPGFLGPLALLLFPGVLLCATEHPPAPGPALNAALTARGTFSVPRARAGDTVEYRLRVEWREVPAAIMVLPPGEELKTPGFTVIGQSALHRKTASAGSIRNVSEFTYLMVARDEGRGRIAPFLLRYRNGLSTQTGDQVETLPVAGATLDIGPARVPFLQRRLVLGGAAFLTFGLILTLSLAAAKRRKRPAAGAALDAEDAFTRGVEALKSRCEAADSRLWLKDAEKLCVAYLCQNLGVGKVRDVRFEAALEQYQARQYQTRPFSVRDPERDQSWTKLRDLFHEARYAGGRKDPYELREACRQMKICLAPQLKLNDPPSVKLEKT